MRDSQVGRKSNHRVTKDAVSRKRLEHAAVAGESPVGDDRFSRVLDLKYGGTREIPSESGPTTVQG